MEYKLRGATNSFKVIAVYARCSHLERLELWEDLEQVACNTSISWLVGSDFNVILDDSEKLGGLPVTQQEILDFAQCMNNCALNELRFTGSRFTWWNERIQEDCIFKRLDRVFGNYELFQAMPNCEVNHLIRKGSDHAPLHVIEITVQVHVKKSFRFLNLWTTHKDFHGIVQQIGVKIFKGHLFK